MSRALLVMAVLTACSEHLESGHPPGCDDTVTLNGETELAFCVTRATTEAERAQGLQGVEELLQAHGLLLVYPITGEVCIFNYGVRFAIDAVFIGRQGEVTGVERNIAPGDETVRCHQDSKYVLEVNAGAAARVPLGGVWRL